MFPHKMYGWPIDTHVKMLKITKHQRNENQKITMRYHPMPVRMAVIKKTIMTSVSEDVEKKQPSRTVRGNVEWHNQNGKKICKFLMKLKTEVSYDPEISLLGIN